ncbi:MAG: hypothetical protein HYZ37_06750 [Candidatus Solibacter usitatus]|nr:hypothetical protein [Candidatus Solibacter usitatus]
MRFVRKAAGTPQRLAILPGAFHPPTLAHLALALTALESNAADEVLLVMPAEFPHKRYEQVSLEQRLELLTDASREHARISTGVSDGGLFVEIARECRKAYGDAPQLRFLCGRDAAERILQWDYGGALPSIEAQLREYQLLVADRNGGVDFPPGLAHAVARLPLPEDYSAHSSTEVRRRLSEGRDWEELVPHAIRRKVAEWYR